MNLEKAPEITVIAFETGHISPIPCWVGSCGSSYELNLRVPVEACWHYQRDPKTRKETTEITRANWWQRGVDYTRLGGRFLHYYEICNKALLHVELQTMELSQIIL